MCLLLLLEESSINHAKLLLPGSTTEPTCDNSFNHSNVLLRANAVFSSFFAVFFLLSFSSVSLIFIFTGTIVSVAAEHLQSANRKLFLRLLDLDSPPVFFEFELVLVLLQLLFRLTDTLAFGGVRSSISGVRTSPSRRKSQIEDDLGFLIELTLAVMLDDRLMICGFGLGWL